MITIKLDDAKERVIALIERQSENFQGDQLAEIRNATYHRRLDDIEMLVGMIHMSEETCKSLIEAVKKAYSISEILLISHMDEPGNALFEADDMVLSEILETKVMVNRN